LDFYYFWLKQDNLGGIMRKNKKPRLKTKTISKEDYILFLKEMGSNFDMTVNMEKNRVEITEQRNPENIIAMKLLGKSENGDDDIFKVNKKHSLLIEKCKRKESLKKHSNHL